jgi:hypothetical protein
MSALSIFVGGWLALNAVVFIVLMLRRDLPVPRDRLFRWVVGDEVHDRQGDLAAIGVCLREPSSDIVGHVEGPALGGVESDDADWQRILALEQVADQRSAVGVDSSVSRQERRSRPPKLSRTR